MKIHQPTLPSGTASASSQQELKALLGHLKARVGDKLQAIVVKSEVVSESALQQAPAKQQKILARFPSIPPYIKNPSNGDRPALQLAQLQVGQQQIQVLTRIPLQHLQPLNISITSLGGVKIENPTTNVSLSRSDSTGLAPAGSNSLINSREPYLTHRVNASLEQQQYRQLLPLQMKPDKALSQLIQLTKIPSAQLSLPQNISQQLHRINNSLPRQPLEFSAKSIQSWLTNSNVLTEKNIQRLLQQLSPALGVAESSSKDSTSKINPNTPQQGSSVNPNISILSSNIQGKSLASPVATSALTPTGLNTALGGSLGQDPISAMLSAVSEPHTQPLKTQLANNLKIQLSSLASQIRQVNEMQISTQQNQSAIQGAPLDRQALDALRSLLPIVTGGLASITLEQLQNLDQQRQSNSTYLSAEIPLKHGEHINPLNISIEEKPAQQNKHGHKVSEWHINLKFNPSKDNEFHAFLCLSDRQLEAILWFNTMAYKKTADKYIKSLKESLFAAGLELRSLQTRLGKPQHAKPAISQRLIDIKT